MTGDDDLTSQQFDADYAKGVPVELEGSPRAHLLADDVNVPGGYLVQPANFSFSGAHKVSPPAPLTGNFASKKSDTRSTAPASVPA